MKKISNFANELAVTYFKKKENFYIETEEDTLKTSSKVEKKKEENGDSRFTRKKFDYSGFERSFKLPKNIKTEDIRADYKNGVLRITLFKKEEKKTFKKMVEIS